MNILRAKIALVGDQRVGKTCLVSQLVKQYFNNTYQTTLGVDYNTFEIKMKDSNYTVQLHIIDCTGFSAFNDLITSQLNDVNFLVYVYDATNLESFQAIKLWKETIKEVVENKNCTEYLVGNKIDLEKKIAVDETSIKNIASVYNLKAFSVSAVRIYVIFLNFKIFFNFRKF
jgi:Ras-related protein Rab-6A